MQNFRAPPNPVPPAAGGFAPRPPKHPPLRISGYAPEQDQDQSKKSSAYFRNILDQKPGQFCPERDTTKLLLY